MNHLSLQATVNNLLLLVSTKFYGGQKEEHYAAEMYKPDKNKASFEIIRFN